MADLAPDPTLFAQTFVTVLVIMDPLGNIPIFLSLTADEPPAVRRRWAFQAVAVAAGVILVFALFGQQILSLLGISLPALQIAGGLLLVLIALELLRPTAEEVAAEAARGRNVALVPLGTPLLAGPGAIAATMLYMRQADDVGSALSVVAALLAVLAVVYLVLRYSVLLGRLLKDNGIHLISRVMGLLLAAIAVQLVASGIAEWIRTGVS
ncbi:MAG TPA: MarC family protein [Egibacteraceae bacterium]